MTPKDPHTPLLLPSPVTRTEMRLCSTGAAMSPRDRKERNPGLAGLTAVTPLLAHPCREPWAPQPTQGGGRGQCHRGGGGHPQLVHRHPPGSPDPWPHVLGAPVPCSRGRAHCLVQPSRSSASQRLVPEPGNHVEAALPGDRHGSPGPPALGVGSGPRLCYFKLDAPTSPLLSRIRATCRSPDTADLALCKLSLSPGHL